MPTNLPPEYYEVEKRYKAAVGVQEKISTLEELLSTIPKHKGTDKLRAAFRKRLSKLRDSAQKQTKTGKQDSVYQIDREGAGQVVVIGSANSGKSSLLANLTNASPDVAEYPFSTWNPTPGMMQFEDIQIQLIDTPPLNRDFVEPMLLDMIRRADLVLILLDLQSDTIQQYEETMERLAENRIYHLDPTAGLDSQPGTYRPFMVMANKCDNESFVEDFEVLSELIECACPVVCASATSGYNIEAFKKLVYEQLKVIRVYSKSPGKEPDMETPFTLKQGTNVEEFASKVHQDFYKNLAFARVWGSADHDGQMVGRDYILQDGDVVELRM